MKMYSTLLTVADIFIPKIIQSLFTEEPKVRKRRKLPNDTTKMTQCMYDFIEKSYSQWLFEREKYEPKLTQKDLVVALNTRLKLHKSISAFRQVWSKKVDRNNLPKGKVFFSETRLEFKS